MTDLGTCHGCGHVLGSPHSRECPVADVDPATGEVTRWTVEAWRKRALAAEAEWRAHSCEDVAAGALDAQADAERQLFEARAEVERLIRERDEVDRIGRDEVQKHGRHLDDRWGAAFAIGWLGARLQETRDVLRKAADSGERLAQLRALLDGSDS